MLVVEEQVGESWLHLTAVRWGQFGGGALLPPPLPLTPHPSPPVAVRRADSRVLREAELAELATSLAVRSSWESGAGGECR